MKIIIFFVTERLTESNIGSNLFVSSIYNTCVQTFYYLRPALKTIMNDNFL